MELTGRSVLVTGGGTGLGRAICREAASRGASVGIVYSRSEREALETVEELRVSGADADAVQADVSQSADVRRAVEWTLGRFGRLDLLINNAGTTKFVPFSDLDAIEESDWDRIVDVNAKGPWLMAKAAAAALIERDGAIMNIASVAGLRPGGSSIPYCVSKAAMIHLTRCLAIALAPRVRVNAIAPGLFLTRWTAGLSEERIAGMVSRTPLQRTVSLEDLARMAVEVACNESMTGEVVAVDGGISLDSSGINATDVHRPGSPANRGEMRDGEGAE